MLAVLAIFQGKLSFYSVNYNKKVVISYIIRKPPREAVFFQ